MLEIYNEAVRDLLASEAEGGRSLEVSGMGAGQLQPGMERIPGLTWRPVAGLEDVSAALAEGSKNRSTASTAMNALSSRSHALLSVWLAAPTPEAAASVLHLIDLAGSERVRKSEVAGRQLKEAQSINKSLSALGDVISALQRKGPHIPFRNSKLTQVLQDSLCGSSKVLLVCNLSPEPGSASETLSSLNFASRAAQVELGPAKKQAPATPIEQSPLATPTSRRLSVANRRMSTPQDLRHSVSGPLI
ncbi:hypothetical protein WJX72_008150 [[Myrmecia] bisecta]|uniref:Kinesin motor domain-containing protein n=1 Tax=[Myrmecia] bisecta TaxID=41462 RepID=A0AAW1P5Y2_9CHLO